MRIIRSVIVAFSLYSRIPMPTFEWEEEDMKHTICFLPFIGIVIGGIEVLLFYVGEHFALSLLTRTCLWIAVPLLVTGGFHLDGFMDVQDALNSYQSKERRLEILKDPHIGAFSVISVVLYYCIYGAAISAILETENSTSIQLVAAGFFLVRGFASLLSVKLKHAKQDGLLHEETKKVGKGSVVWILFEVLLGVGIMALLDVKICVVIGMVLALFCFYFWKKCEKAFGGVTGDTMGYFITVCELLVACVVSIMMIGMR